MVVEQIVQWTLGITLIFSSLGVVFSRNPVNSSLSFLLTLLALAALFMELSAEFISVMQILVYAGAILVIFMFVLVLFQDAHQQLSNYKPKSSQFLLITAGAMFIVSLVVLGRMLVGIVPLREKLPENYGSVESLGYALYVDFFFPFEAVILIFLIAVVGSLYIARKRV